MLGVKYVTFVKYELMMFKKDIKPLTLGKILKVIILNYMIILKKMQRCNMIYFYKHSLFTKLI